MLPNKLIKSITVFTFLLLQLFTVSYAGKPPVLKFAQGAMIFITLDCTDSRDVMVHITGMESAISLDNLPSGIEYRDFVKDEVVFPNKKGIVIYTEIYNLCDKDQLRIYSPTEEVIKAVDFEEIEIECEGSKTLELTSPEDESVTKKTDNSEELAIQTENNASERDYFTVFIKDGKDVKIIDEIYIGVRASSHPEAQARVVFRGESGLSTCYNIDLTNFKLERDGFVYSVSCSGKNMLFNIKNHQQITKSLVFGYKEDRNTVLEQHFYSSAVEYPKEVVALFFHDWYKNSMSVFDGK